MFQRYQQVNTRYKMNEAVINFLLAGDKFMPEISFKAAYIYIQCLWTICNKQKKITKM